MLSNRSEPVAERDRGSKVERGLSVAVHVLLAVFVAASVHTFFSYVDHYPYWSIDDGLAVVSTSWQQTGVYGDPSVPVEPLAGVQRYRGFFDYGPWYFLTGTGAVWLFGFSVKVLRSIHLLAGLTLVPVAHRLFTGLRGATSTAIVGVCVCYAVVHIQWPMVRPDPFVTLFAGGSIAAAATATLTGRVRYWFVSGFAAACGMFSHPIGGTLLPASLVTMVIAVACGPRPDDALVSVSWRRTLIRSTAALVGGWCTSAFMFYASFGFRFRDHINQILTYRSSVRVSTVSALSSASPVAVWSEHYRIATSGVDGVYVLVLALALAVAPVLLLRGWQDRATRAESVALLVPGWTIFVCYVVGLGFYQNFHTGYVILPQLIGIWIGASTLYVGLGAARARLPTIGRTIEIGVAVVLTVFVARLTYAEVRSADDPRMGLAGSWIGISTYINEVLGPLPRGAIAWGAYQFAAEGPQRIQLVSFETAARVFARVPVDRRPELAPDFLVWGHPQNRDAIVYPLTDAVNDPVTLLRTLLPDAEFSVTSLTAGVPYGTTRVFSRQFSGMSATGLPLVSAWDTELQRWLHRVDPLTSVKWSSAKGSLHVSKGRQHWMWDAADAATADLPADWYLFRVPASGRPRSREMITAGSGTAHDFSVGDLPPPIDVAVRLAPEPGYLLLHHDGGILALNLFATDVGARIGTIETFRIAGFDDYRLERERSAEKPLPEWPAWLPDSAGGVTVAGDGQTLTVSGNASPSGYQLVSPRLAVPHGADVTIRLHLEIQAGRVCTGVLDEQRRTWLVAPTDHAETHRFSAGANGAVFVVVANCNSGSGAAASRFALTAGRYAIGQERWYIDRLMRFW